MKKERKFSKVLKILCSLMLFAVISGANWTDTVWAAEGNAERQTDTEIADVSVNETNFPDENFRNYVLEKLDTNKDKILSKEEIEKVKVINVSMNGIDNLKGIEYFSFLEELNCYSNRLSSLNVGSNITLTKLICSSNHLNSLDISKNIVLTTLDCNNNQLSNLNVSSNTALTSLICYNNQLTSLDVSNNTALTSLNCQYNQLSSLDISSNTALTSLNCQGNQLTSLDASNHTALTELFCGGLSSLDVSNTALTSLEVRNGRLKNLNVRNAALTRLICDGNQLTDLDISCNPALTVLNCQKNQLSSLDVSKNPALITLDCDDNQLISLNVSSNPKLTYLYCQSNQLTSLDISKNPVLTKLLCASNQLTSLDVSSNTALTYLHCSSNPLSSLNVSNTALISLNVSNMELSSLNVCNNQALTTLVCYNNQLSSLDVSTNPALTTLECYNNQLSSLNVCNTALTKLICHNNQLSSLDVSKNTELRSLYCEDNQLVSLDVSKNTELRSLYCNNNQLTSLDVNKNTALLYLECNSNQLSSLDVSKNTVLERLECNNNQLSSLDVSKNLGLTTLECNNNQLTNLDIRSQYACWFSCYENPLKMLLLNRNENTKISWDSLLNKHGTGLGLSNLSNIQFNSYYLYIIDKNKPASYIYPYHYQDGDKDAVENLQMTIYYMNPEETPPSLPAPEKPSPTPENPTPTPENPNPIPEPTSTPENPTPTPEPTLTPENPTPIPGTHLFLDYQYSTPVSGAAIVYGNGGTLKNPDGTKTNTKLFTVYTNITPSYQFTVKQNKVKAASGKVIAGLTLSEKKPTLQKGKIVNAEAAKIAKASVKNGVVTVTATGKGGGTVYLWIMDTGSLGMYECCPVEVKLLPTKLKVQNASGSEIKNLSLAVGSSQQVYIAGLVGTIKAEDGTYTATVDTKSKDYIEVTKGNAPGQFKITALKQNSKAKTTKATVTFTCDQNGKKIKLTVTITK